MNDKKKKEMLEKLMKNYVDRNGCMDITKFRTDNPNEYALLPHYFGGVNQAIEQSGWIKMVKSKTKTGNRVRLRDLLAYDRLTQLRQVETLQQTADRYGVTRPAINQLFKVLQAAIEQGEVVVEEVEDSEPQ